MRLNAPKKIIFMISLILGILGVLGGLGVIPMLAGYSFWVLTAAWALITASTVLKGM